MPIKDIRRRALTLAWITALVAAALGSAIASAATGVASCPPKHARVTVRAARVVVYAEDSGIDPDSGGEVTTYYACVRPEGKPVAVGETVASGGEYPANVEMRELRTAGTFVSEQSAAGFASLAACGKYEPAAGCDGIVKYWVEIADVAVRRTVKLFVSGQVSSLELSPAGAAAWVVSTPAPSPYGSPTSTLYATVVHRAGRGSLSATPRVIDSGQAITAVSFAGSSLRWSNGGQRRSRTIS